MKVISGAEILFGHNIIIAKLTPLIPLSFSKRGGKEGQAIG